MKTKASFFTVITLCLVLFTLSGCTLPEYPTQTPTPSPISILSPSPIPTQSPAAAPSSPVETYAPQTEGTAAPTSTPFETQTPIATYTPNPIEGDFSKEPVFSSTEQEHLADYISVISKVRPSVVVIHTEVPAFDLFTGTTTQKGAGSGWVYDSGGLIVTNYHVIEGANSITITLDDGRQFVADTVRTDSVTDLAILKIDAPGLTALELEDSSKLKVGELVVAIGNSLDEGISATNGIISATGISITTETGEILYDLIKTNAAINPGNSGGPLVNMAGKVIGITGAKVAQIGVEGSGYAISTAVALPIINELITNGFVSRPWLGVSLYTVDMAAIQALDLSVDSGVLIRQVVRGSPADKAGIKRYDVITSFEGEQVETKEDLVKVLRSQRVGQIVEVEYWRGENKSVTYITLGQSPPPETP
ncbi:MAG: trypsin-like peptidase domain-containing protein [Dehalococcoidales bacterium]|nr:trypsin-like peptidase domain-containing protein [Dehalococcoidales bacterium]